MLYSRKLATYGLSAALLLGSTGGVFAQTNSSGANTPPAATTSTADRSDTDNHGDWGWVGLIGLIGLAGLAGRRTRDIRTTQPSRDGTYRAPGE